MSFEAGAITGRLGLDTSEYSEAMRESTSIAGIFAEEIGHIIGEATGSPILGELANGISEVVSAGGTGKWGEAFAAAIHTAGGAISGMIEMVKGTAEYFDHMEIAAKRAGVSVEWLSTYGKASEAFGVGVDSLTQSIDILQRNAGSALVDHTKDQSEAFHDLGISLEWVKDHQNDVSAMFQEVISKLAQVADKSEQAKLGTDLFGRGFADLRPLLENGGNAVLDLQQRIEDLHGGVTKADADMGKDWAVLSTEFSAMIQGIENAAARPILKALSDNSAALSADLKTASDELTKDIPGAMTAIGEAVKSLGPILADAAEHFAHVAEAAGNVVAAVTPHSNNPERHTAFEGYFLDPKIPDPYIKPGGPNVSIQQEWTLGDIPANDAQRDFPIAGMPPINYRGEPPVQKPSAPATTIIINVNAGASSDEIANKVRKHTKDAVEKARKDHIRKTNAGKEIG